MKPKILISSLSIILILIINYVVTGTDISSSQNSRKSVLDVVLIVPCQQVIKVEEWYDEDPAKSDDPCKYTRITMDCWAGGWDIPCLAGIELTVECPEEDPIVVGGFNSVNSCKEPA